jgi:hypothetical protein
MSNALLEPSVLVLYKHGVTGEVWRTDRHSEHKKLSQKWWNGRGIGRERTQAHEAIFLIACLKKKK